MSDTGPPPAAPAPPSVPLPPSAPPPRRSGWLTAFMIIIGVILLLPGICALIFGAGMSHPDPVITTLVLLGLALGAGGVWLIAAAIRGPRR
jgi:hypothetical protein